MQASAKVPTTITPPAIAPQNRDQARAALARGNAETQEETTDRVRQEDLSYWDNLFGITEDSDDAEVAAPKAAPQQDDLPPECLRLALPSNDNVSAVHKALELAFRIRKAEAILSSIRQLIAEKSFKYTDEIRKAPRKGVRTRGRTSILELNRQLSFLCQTYSWNRSRMIDLDADNETLCIYQVLQQDDVRSSTTVIKPNEPGSTTLKLSWIWHSLDRRVMAGEQLPESDDNATTTECK